MGFCPATGHFGVFGIQKRQKTMIFAIFEENLPTWPVQTQISSAVGRDIFVVEPQTKTIQTRRGGIFRRCRS